MSTENQHISSYTGGMDKETSVSKYDKNKYYHAEELRLVTHSGLNSGSLNSVKGNALHFSLNSANEVYLGHCFIRDKIVIFSKYLSLDEDRIYYSDFIDGDFTVTPDDLKFSGNLGFNSNYPIKAIGRYETEGVEKVYWTDGLNNVRHANLSENILWYTSDQFDFLPNIDFSNINIDSIGSGNLKVGVVQYSYQYYNLRGSESAYAPASGLIDLSPKNLNYGDTRQFFGGDIGDNSGKSVTISIDTGDNINKFDRVRIIRIHHEDINILPIIDIVAEQEITASISFTDTGSIKLETIPAEFFQEVKNLFICNDLEVKNNYLFTAGINEQYFDFDFDARAYRFTDNSGGSVDINDFVTVNDDKVIFTKAVVFRTTAKAGLTGDSPFNDFWYIDNDIIYFLAPLGFSSSVDGTAYSTDSITDSGTELGTIYNFALGLLTFGTRDIHSTKGITQTDAELDQPVGWDPATSGDSQALLLGNNDIVITPATIAGDSDHWGVPRTHNAISPFNYLNNALWEDYKYNRSGVLGGEGPNVSYTFDTKPMLIDNSGQTKYFYTGTELEVDNTSYTNYASPFIKMLYTGYQRDEIYAFAIVGYDKKGRQSFAQWIGDIRFPKITDTGFELITASGSNIFANILYIKFTVNNLPADVDSYQIVRCERTQNDRTVLDSGLIGSIGLDSEVERRFNLDLSNELRTDSIGGGSYACNRLFEYISPEVNFQKDTLPILTDYLEIVQRCTVNKTTVFSNTGGGASTTYSSYIQKVSNYENSATHSNTRYSLDDIKLFNTSMDTSSSISVDGEMIPNQVYNAHSTPEENDDSNYKGTSLVLRTELVIPATDRSTTQSFLTYRRRDISPYGGNTYNARSVRSYIACSNVIDKVVSGPTSCFKGDTFIDFFDYLRVIWNQERPATHSVSSAVYFPVETTINLSLRLDKSMSKLVYDVPNATEILEHYKFAALKETAGVHLLRDKEDWSNPYYTQVRDLYQYNPVYSKSNNIRQFSAKPFDFDILTQNSFDCRVTNTEKKINGEMSDSWTIVRFNNILEVDTKRGPITAIENVGDSLLYFQPEGIGVLSIEERELTQSSTAGQLSLGTGGVLARYDYLSTSDGCSDKFSILETKTGLYFFDRKNNCVSKLGENIEEITKILGLQPYFNQNVDSSGVIRSAYNRKYNELLFTYDGNNEFTIALDELSSTFTTFYSFIPKAYITKGQHLFSTFNGRAFFKHDEGATSTYYGTTYPSKLTLIINPGGHQMCRFDVMRFITDVRDTDGDYISKTFSSLRAKTSYQDTGDINLDDEAVERMKVWRYNKFRDDEDDEPSLKDTYMIVELTFANTSNEVIRIDDIVTMFTPIRIH